MFDLFLKSQWYVSWEDVYKLKYKICGNISSSTWIFRGISFEQLKWESYFQSQVVFDQIMNDSSGQASRVIPKKKSGLLLKHESVGVLPKKSFESFCKFFVMLLLKVECRDEGCWRFWVSFHKKSLPDWSSHAKTIGIARAWMNKEIFKCKTTKTWEMNPFLNYKFSRERTFQISFLSFPLFFSFFLSICLCVCLFLPVSFSPIFNYLPIYLFL